MSETKNMSKVRRMVECALLLAIGFVLMSIKIFEMPNGGSITLVSMLPFIIISFRHGVKWGLLAGLACSLLQMMTGLWAPPAGTIVAWIGMLLFDYILAFSLLGLACVFAKPFRNRMVGVAVGTAVVCALRYLCAVLSGCLIWASIVTDGFGAVAYSVTYNASYMLPETVLTVAITLVLYKLMPQLFGSAD